MMMLRAVLGENLWVVCGMDPKKLGEFLRSRYPDVPPVADLVNVWGARVPVASVAAVLVAAGVDELPAHNAEFEAFKKVPIGGSQDVNVAWIALKCRSLLWAAVLVAAAGGNVESRQRDRGGVWENGWSAKARGSPVNQGAWSVAIDADGRAGAGWACRFWLPRRGDCVGDRMPPERPLV